jgi:hypothetical protein
MNERGLGHRPSGVSDLAKMHVAGNVEGGRIDSPQLLPDAAKRVEVGDALRAARRLDRVERTPRVQAGEVPQVGTAVTPMRMLADPASLRVARSVCIDCSTSACVSLDQSAPHQSSSPGRPAFRPIRCGLPAATVGAPCSLVTATEARSIKRERSRAHSMTRSEAGCTRSPSALRT